MKTLSTSNYKTIRCLGINKNNKRCSNKIAAKGIFDFPEPFCSCHLEQNKYLYLGLLNVNFKIKDISTNFKETNYKGYKRQAVLRSSENFIISFDKKTNANKPEKIPYFCCDSVSLGNLTVKIIADLDFPEVQDSKEHRSKVNAIGVFRSMFHNQPLYVFPMKHVITLTNGDKLNFK